MLSNQESKVEFSQALILSGMKYSTLRKRYQTKFPDANAQELESNIIPIVKARLLHEAKELESQKNVERFKAVSRLGKRLYELEKLISFELKAYRKACKDYSEIYLAKEGRQISNANIARVFNLYIECQDKINKLLGLEEISVNLIKGAVSRIPELADNELYIDLQKILTIRGFLPSQENITAQKLGNEKT